MNIGFINTNSGDRCIGILQKKNCFDCSFKLFLSNTFYYLRQEMLLFSCDDSLCVSKMLCNCCVPCASVLSLGDLEVEVQDV